MRTIKELLQLMLDHQEYFDTGLCLWTTRMYQNGLFTSEERNCVRDYIRNNRPTDKWTYDALFYQKKPERSTYYWTVFEIGPRKRWLKRHIRKNSSSSVDDNTAVTRLMNATGGFIG
jgi:hypothetical protein